MFRVQQQIASNQWVDVSRSPQGLFAQMTAAVRRTVSAEAAVRVVSDAPQQGEKVDILV